MKPTVSRSHDPLRAAPLQDTYRHKSHVWIMGKFWENLEEFYGLFVGPMVSHVPSPKPSHWTNDFPMFFFVSPNHRHQVTLAFQQRKLCMGGLVSSAGLEIPPWTWLGKLHPLVNIQKNYCKSPLLIGKSTITGPFSIAAAMLVYWRVNGGCSELLLDADATVFKWWIFRYHFCCYHWFMVDVRYIQGQHENSTYEFTKVTQNWTSSKMPLGSCIGEHNPMEYSKEYKFLVICELLTCINDSLFILGKYNFWLLPTSYPFQYRL